MTFSPVHVGRRLVPPDGLLLPLGSPGDLDQAAARRRQPEWLARAMADPASRVLVLREDSAIVADADGRIRWVAPADLEPATPLTFLGVDGDGVALFSTAGIPDGSDTSPVNLRDIGSSLAEGEAAAAAEAIALASWQRLHPRCAVCGAETAVTDAGHKRRCPSCGAGHFPRVDPAVIMLVSDGDRCVLGRRSTAPPGRWSALAGYVEPGESLEAAVAREVREEVGLEVRDVRYRGSQPWPFPSSLMLAFEARADWAPLVVSPEHEEVRWFTRDELATGLSDGTLGLPGPIAAGHHLVRSWLERPDATPEA